MEIGKVLFGADYCTKIREMLQVDEKLLPDRIIEAPANIGATILMGLFLEEKLRQDEKINEKLIEMALHHHCAVLSKALDSRTQTENYKYAAKDWNELREYHIKCAVKNENEIYEILGL